MTWRAGEKGYNGAGFAVGLRQALFTSNILRKALDSTIDGRTNGQPGNTKSQKARKRMEEPFGRIEVVGDMAQNKACSIKKVSA